MKLKVLVSTIVSIMIWPASIMAQSELIPMIEIPAGNFYMGTLGEDENYDELQNWMKKANTLHEIL